MVQVFVRSISSTQAYSVEAASSHVSQLKALVQEREGFAASSLSSLGLVYAGRQLEDGALLTACGISHGSTVQLVVRVLGGKGGFGALLRGQGRDGNVTTNFDACRDLQGRRIRHSRAEQQLAEWQSQSKERELEKVGQQHIKEIAKQQKRESQDQVDVDKVMAEQKQAMDKVQDAVQDALKFASASSESSKRKAQDAAASKPAAKKSKMLACLEEIDDSDDEGSDDS